MKTLLLGLCSFIALGALLFKNVRHTQAVRVPAKKDK